MLPTSVSVTEKTGVNVVGAPVSWQTSNGSFTVEHVAAVTADDRLMAFWWSPQHDWQSVDITAKTGRHVVGAVTAWQTRNGPFLVEHLAARTPAGELVVFWWSPQHDWQVGDVTAITGKSIAGAPVAWQTKNGANTVEHLAARGAHDELLGFWWSPAHDWQAIDVSAIAGGSAAGAAISWLTGTVEHVAVRGSAGELIVYWWTPAANWRSADVTAITGRSIAEVSGVYQLAETGQNAEIVMARGTDDALLRFWWRPDRDWQVQNLSHATGIASSVAPSAWQTPNGVAIIEHVAAVTAAQSLVIVYDDGESRRWTDATGEPPAPMKRLKGRGRIVSFLWDPHRPSDPAPSVATVEATIFGASSSVRDYFLQVSGNAFTIENAGMLGWFDASRPPGYWWGPQDTNDADHDGWVDPHKQKWAEAIRAADPQFDFKAFDGDPVDGVLRPDELGVLIVIPQNSPFGSNRGALGREFPNPMPLVVDGVTIPVIAEAYLGSPPNIGVVAHELGHLVASLPDLYFALPNDERWKGIPFDNPFAAGDYCLMDATYNNAHFCPFLKLKLGWLRPTLILRSGSYALHAIEQEREAWVLLHPDRGTREYFIIENRFPVADYDMNLPDRGLGIWHVIEDPQLYATHIPPVPPNPPAASRQDLWAEKWGLIGNNDWGRRGIRMIRPVWDTLRRTQSLWDGSDPATGYDLLPDAPPPHASLRWADGTPSGFAVRNISPAGATMTAEITVPW